MVPCAPKLNRPVIISGPATVLSRARLNQEVRITSEFQIELEAPPCNLCGEERFEAVYQDCKDVYEFGGPLFSVVRCVGCGLVRTRPRPTQTSIGRYYGPGYVSWKGANRRPPRWIQAPFRLPHRLRYGRASEELPPPPHPGARVLDIGAGTGRLVEAMQKLGWKASAIEPDPSAAATIRSRRRAHEVLVERAERVELPSDHFDEIICVHTAEHLHDPVGVMRKAWDWLRPDGRIRLWVPNFDSVERRLFGRYWNGLDVPRHLHHFSRGTITALLRACGFRVERIAVQFQGTSLGASVQSALAQLGLSRRGPYKASGIAYYIAVPLGWLLSGHRNGAFIEVEARPVEQTWN